MPTAPSRKVLSLEPRALGVGVEDGCFYLHPTGDASLKESSGHLRGLPHSWLLAPSLEGALHLLLGTSHRWARRGPREGVSFPETLPHTRWASSAFLQLP